MPECYEIRIRKEALKFAASHMTVFQDGTKEALHGHQYQPTLSVGVKDVSFQKTILFSEIKSAMKKIAALWDEKVLLATKNPHFKLKSHTKKSIEFILCGKQYLLPTDEVILLQVDNVTCENLAKAYFEFLKMELDCIQDKNIRSVSVYIEESPGQGAAYTYVK
jgi:6-pyruvoyltetrahydropterin/6-carboxytetrahydropterin synthase